MVDLTYYIKAKSIADMYMRHIQDLNGTTKKQHFLSRLSLCVGYYNVLNNRVFTYTQKTLEKHIEMNFNDLWDESMGNDEYGYKKKIKEKANDDIKFYFGMTQIIGETCILLRNKIELPKNIDKKINRHNLIKMINVANVDDVIKKYEGTTYVNGIGGIICLKQLKNSLVPISWDTINNCYKSIFEYYISICSKSQDWLKSQTKLHNNIYGLTHCIINLTNFYIQSLDNNIFEPQIKQACSVLISLIDGQSSSNYKIFNDDTLAEMLLCIKLSGMSMCTERLAALASLSLRWNSSKMIFNEHKCDTIKEELLKNEHTNILYILNVLL